MIPAGKTGIERDAVQLVLDVPPIDRSRYQPGPDTRWVRHSLRGNAITTQLVTDEQPSPLVLEIVIAAEAQASTLAQLIAGAGPVTVRTDPAGPDQQYTIGPESQQLLEPLLGHYPDTAPTEVRDDWTLTITLYLAE